MQGRGSISADDTSAPILILWVYVYVYRIPLYASCMQWRLRTYRTPFPNCIFATWFNFGACVQDALAH